MKKSKLDQRGSSIFQFSFYLFLFFLIYLLGILFIKKNIYQQQNLIQAKICFNQLSSKHLSYVDYMIKTNNLIRASHLGDIAPPFSAYSSEFRKLVQYSQEINYFWYQFDLPKSKFCHFNQYRVYLGSMPFEREQSLFKREISGAVILKKSTYDFFLCFTKINLLIKNSFDLKLSEGKSLWEAREKENCHWP